MIDGLLSQLNRSYDRQEELIRVIELLTGQLAESRKLLEACGSFAARRSLALENLEKAVRDPGKN
jgi:hypothetical protein